MREDSNNYDFESLISFYLMNDEDEVLDSFCTLEQAKQAADEHHADDGLRYHVEGIGCQWLYHTA